MHKLSGQINNSNPSGSGVQGMLNRRFWGKKSLKPRGKALAKAKLEKKLATNQND